MWNAVVCSPVRGLQEAVPAATIALEISSRNARVAALQKRWGRLRAELDLILDHGADMARSAYGASGLLVCDWGEGADRLVTRIDPGVVSLVAGLGGPERQAAAEVDQWKTHHEERRVINASPTSIWPCCWLTRSWTCWRRALGMEKSRGADDLVDQMS
jgi:hypothetical protein